LDAICFVLGITNLGQVSLVHHNLFLLIELFAFCF
jgi:hypothetical protein